MRRVLASMLVALIATGCATGQSYEGERRARDEVAKISGDLRVTAGAPVTVILRKVDGYELGLGENSVEVLPGKRQLLVDCRIAETSSTTRLSIEAEVYAGERYRLVAETGPGLRGCASVSLEIVD
jgi:hypothetical protein